MRSAPNSIRAFSLIEAIVSVALILVGIVATMTSLGAVSKAQTRSLESEDMQRLAIRKYDEILATGILPSGQTSGDFSDIQEPRFQWTAERTQTGSGNLDSIKVEVVRKGESFTRATIVRGLLCRPAPKKTGGAK